MLTWSMMLWRRSRPQGRVTCGQVMEADTRDFFATYTRQRTASERTQRLRPTVVVPDLREQSRARCLTGCAITPGVGSPEVSVIGARIRS